MNKVICFRKKSIHFFSIENVFDSLLPHLRINRLELPFDSSAWMNRFKNILFLRRQKASMIHISGHDHYLLWYPFKNVLLTIHDIESLKRKKGLKRWVFKKLWFDIPIANAALVSTISEFSKKEIESIGNYKTPIRVVSNPLSLPLKYSPKPLLAERPKLLHIGTKENKNLNRTLEAISGLDVELIIRGEKDSRIIEKLESLNVHYNFRPRLDKTQMQALYEEIDMLLFVSTYEGFGLPIIEAQAVGRPVLTSNCSSMPEVAGKGAYLVDPYSVESIKSGLQELLESENKRLELVKEGLKNIERFHPKEIAERYQELYNELE